MEHEPVGSLAAAAGFDEVRLMRAVSRLIALAGTLLSAVLAPGQIADFREVRRILETSCLGCHGPQKAYGNLRVDSAAALRKGGSRGPAVIAGQQDRSPLLTTIELAAGKTGAMPPGGPQLTKEQRAAIRQWIAAGAPWPDGITLGAAGGKPDERAVVEQLRKRIAANAPGPMKAYTTTIPGSTVSFDMLPIPGGEFTMGTPGAETGRRPDEGPQHKVKIAPFWMGKYEVTWDEYRLFMFANLSGEKAANDALVDAVSRPTRPYVEMSFGMGINGYPAISMTQHAANKYAQWLSARTGHFYRLPTEAEWEYACRAGTATAYSFGDDASKLGEYAWFATNSNGKYEKVGTKKPNPWGLHDMHGNVVEWTLDQYSADSYAKTPTLPWVRSRTPYPHTARGGSWNDDPAGCRCGARMASDPSWKMQDPQLPKSIWYLTDAQWLGFRLVRPLQVPPADEMFACWNNGVEKE